MSKCDICGKTGNMELCPICKKKWVCSWCQCDCPLPETDKVHYIGYYKNFEERHPFGSKFLDSERAYCGTTFHFTNCTNKINETTCEECLKGWINACEDAIDVCRDEIKANTVMIHLAKERLLELDNE